MKQNCTPRFKEIRFRTAHFSAAGSRSAIRHATKELPVYDLVPAKRGVKLQQSGAGGCAEADLGAISSSAQSPPAPHAVICGNIYTTMTGSDRVIEGRRVTLRILAQTLSDLVGAASSTRPG
jgi:uncharacterized protein (TIGR03435 family)